MPTRGLACPASPQKMYLKSYYHNLYQALLGTNGSFRLQTIYKERILGPRQDQTVLSRALIAFDNFMHDADTWLPIDLSALKQAATISRTSVPIEWRIRCELNIGGFSFITILSNSFVLISPFFVTLFL